eukprot:5865278-Pleurochrysis_carterae.AAC.3
MLEGMHSIQKRGRTLRRALVALTHARCERAEGSSSVLCASFLPGTGAKLPVDTYSRKIVYVCTFARVREQLQLSVCRHIVNDAMKPVRHDALAHQSTQKRMLMHMRSCSLPRTPSKGQGYWDPHNQEACIERTRSVKVLPFHDLQESRSPPQHNASSSAAACSKHIATASFTWPAQRSTSYAPSASSPAAGPSCRDKTEGRRKSQTKHFVINVAGTACRMRE